MLTLQTPLGPVEYMPRDLVAMPRNARPTVRVKPAQIRGVTYHYSGGRIAGYYRDRTVFDGDYQLIKAAIRSHNARTGEDRVSDVGYGSGIGLSGVVFEMRGLEWQNAANGKLPDRAKFAYPAGTPSSNPYWRSVFMCAGVETSGEFGQPTPEQWQAAQRWASYLAQLDRLAAPRACGHRDVRATACPGTVLYPRLQELVPGHVPPVIPDDGLYQVALAIADAKTFRLVLNSGGEDAPLREQNAVWWLQHGLNQQMPLGVKPLKTDKDFGPVTRAAVIAFQKAQLASDIDHHRFPRMVVDGIVYKQTWGRLYP